MHTRQQSIAAGAELRRLRTEMRLTQQDVERMTAERFGREARVYAQQVSRIENGGLEKPPILDLLRYGQILGKSPDDIAEMYGLWPRPATRSELDPRLQSAIDLAGELPLVQREKFLEWVRFAVLQARTEAMPAPEPSERHSTSTRKSPVAKR